MNREQEKQRLLAQKQALHEKYPPEVYERFREEPLDVLRHCREVVRYSPANRAELDELSFYVRKS